MDDTPQKEHQWLQRLVGDWTAAGEAGGPVCTERVRQLGGLWVVAESAWIMPDGQQVMNIMTLGFDPKAQRFVGTWVGSAMSHLWVYSGRLDESGDVLVLECEGPDLEDTGTIARYRDLVEFVRDDYRVLTSLTEGPDGAWREIMSTRYQRIS